MAGSKSKSTSAAAVPGKRDNSGRRISSGKRVSSGGSTPSLAPAASPSSATRRTAPPQHPPQPEDLQRTSTSKTLSQNRRQVSSPGSHASTLRRPQPSQRIIPQPVFIPSQRDELLANEYELGAGSGDEEGGEEDEEAADDAINQHHSPGEHMNLDALLLMEGRDTFLPRLSPNPDEGIW